MLKDIFSALPKARAQMCSIAASALENRVPCAERSPYATYTP